VFQVLGVIVPIVDVVVPTYNRAFMLRECLESVRTQDFQNFQVTIGDDCSSDTTPDVAREFCSLDSRFRYVRNTRNLGQWGNVNALVAGATASYVHILHDDDWIEPTFYSELVQVLDSTPGAGLAFCRSVVSQVGDEYPPTLPMNWPQNLSGGGLLSRESAFQWVLRWQVVPLDAALLRTSTLREVGPFVEEFMSSDWLMWLEMSVGHDLAVVDAPLAHYRIHGAQVSANTFSMYLDILRMLSSAGGVPLLEGHAAELSETRFSMFRSYVLTLKENNHPRDDILALASAFGQLDNGHRPETRRVVRMALIYAAAPVWFKRGLLGKRTRLRHMTKRLLGFDHLQRENR
jgi:glycosyltransferase involved in cell wall biosynthesis